MHLFLVHHGEAVAADVDARRPLSTIGRANVDRVAALAAARGARPLVVWHSGKLRAKQTAEAYWKACNALADLSVQKDLQPDDPAQRIRDRVRAETRDVMLAGHFPNLPRLLELLVGQTKAVPFPTHGVVALVSKDEGATWRELWRIDG
jgi:phosphohistidine phosphatase